MDLGGNALIYNGSSWSTPTDINSTNTLYSVSCASSSFCVPVGVAGNALVYNGSTWSTPADIDSTNTLYSVSVYVHVILRRSGHKRQRTDLQRQHMEHTHADRRAPLLGFVLFFIVLRRC